MELGRWSGPTATTIRESLDTANDMAKAKESIKMDQATLGSTKPTSHQAKEFISGKMGRAMKANGLMAYSKAEA